MRLYYLLFMLFGSVMNSITCSSPLRTPIGDTSSSQTDNVVTLRPVLAVVNETSSQVTILNETKVLDVVGLQHAQFLDPNIGWVTTKTSIYKTSDSGTTWRKLDISASPDSYISSFYFVSETRGWLVVVNDSGLQGASYGDSSRIFTTPDGGKTWAEQAKFDSDVKIAAVRFLNEYEGLAVGSQLIGDRPPREEIFAVRTTDGGKTWNNVSDRIRPFTRNEYGNVFDPGVFIQWTTASRLFLLTRLGRIITSSDSGLSWTNIVQFQDERPDGTATSNRYLKIVLDSSSHIRVIGGSMGQEGFWGNLILEDERAAWTSYELVRIPILDAVFLSDKEIIACGTEFQRLKSNSITTADQSKRGVILHSTNGGKSWSIIYRSSFNAALMFLISIDNEHLNAIGENGILIRLLLQNR